MSQDRPARIGGVANSERLLTDLLALPLRDPAEPDGELPQRAGEFIAHLRTQLAELDRREQNVNAQYSALDQERRRLRLTQQQMDEDLQRRDDELERRAEELSRRESKFDEVRQAWEKQREEMETDRAQLEQCRAELAAERERLQQEFIAEQSRRQSLIDEQEQALEELQQEQQRLQAEQQRDREQAIASLKQELEELRRNRISDIELELASLNEEIVEKRQWWDEEQARTRAHLEQELEGHEHRLAALDQEFQEEQFRKRSELEQREQQLIQQGVDIEKRAHFHEAHLEQLRHSLEERQREFDLQQQRVRAANQQQAEDLRLRAGQLHRFRNMLEHVEESLERERGLLTEARLAFETMYAQKEAHWQRDREKWDQECQTQRSDFHRQQEMLALHAENLDARRKRLDTLRDELEVAHRETLEIRLAVEQTWSQLSQTFGEGAARQRVEQFRTAIAGHFENVRVSLQNRQRELDEAAQRLEQQRESFRKERREFAAWITERDSQLRARELSVEQEIAASEERESQWQSTHARWLMEKLEAESVIRQLLSELNLGIAAASPFDPESADSQHEAETAPPRPGFLPHAETIEPSPAAA